VTFQRGSQKLQPPSELPRTCSVSKLHQVQHPFLSRVPSLTSPCNLNPDLISPHLPRCLSRKRLRSLECVANFPSSPPYLLLDSCGLRASYRSRFLKHRRKRPLDISYLPDTVSVNEYLMYKSNATQIPRLQIYVGFVPSLSSFSRAQIRLAFR